MMGFKRSLKFYGLFLLIKLQAFCIGAGAFLLITHFNLNDASVSGNFAYFYHAMGFMSVFIVIYSLCPIPEIEVRYIKRVLKEEEE